MYDVVSTSIRYPVIINYSIWYLPWRIWHSHLRAVIKVKKEVVGHSSNKSSYIWRIFKLRVAIWFHWSSRLKKTQLPSTNHSPKQHTCWKQKAFLWFQKNKNTKLYVDDTNTNRNKEKHWIMIFIKIKKELFFIVTKIIVTEFTVLLYIYIPFMLLFPRWSKTTANHSKRLLICNVLFAGCTYVKEEEKQESARSMIRRVSQKQRPCLQ